MSITFIILNPVTGKEVCRFSFDNMIDSTRERATLDRAGVDYKVEWDCTHGNQ